MVLYETAKEIILMDNGIMTSIFKPTALVSRADNSVSENYKSVDTSNESQVIQRINEAHRRLAEKAQ